MDKQGFDPMDEPLTAVIDLMEHVKLNKDLDTDKNTKQVSKKEGKEKSGKKSTKPSGKQNLYCMIHGHNNSHQTEDCYQLQKEAKRLKSESNGNKSSGKFKNKTWSCKAKEAKQASKNDLASFIKKEVKKGVKKDLKALSKKRKSKESDSKEDGELHMFDLKDFNYEDMENLKIDDKVSI